VKNKFVSKPRFEWIENDQNKFCLNLRGMKILYDSSDEVYFDKLDL